VTSRGRAKRMRDMEDEVERRRSPRLRAWAPSTHPERRAELARNYLEVIAVHGDHGPEARAAGEEFMAAIEVLEARHREHQEPPDPPD